MPGPPWDDDQAIENDLIVADTRALLHDMRADADNGVRNLPGLATAREWHRRIYDGVSVPSRAYVGAFRGDPSIPDLVDYEVGVGIVLADGLPERVGVWASDVASEVAAFAAGLDEALHLLDAELPVGQTQHSPDQLGMIVSFIAEVHGDWIRIHPFANGNGRTARAWAAFIALRYGLPVFVSVKPRPDDVAYARAAKASMGRPPDFVGDHSEAQAVFAHLLAETLHGHR